MSPAPLARPAKALTGVILLYISLALGLIRAALGLPSLAHSEGVPLWISLAVLLVIAAVQLWFIVMMGKGRNWARIVYLVLFLLGTLMLIFVLVSGAPLRGSVAMDAVQTLIQIVALALLFTPEANAWFRAVKAVRKAG